MGATMPAALAGAFLVASLPLANVHVALAGYADLPMAAWYTAAALALLRWTRSRDARDAALALLLAIACTQIKNPGWFWAATLVPGIVVALMPRHGIRAVAIGFAAVAVALVVLARFKFTLFNYQVNLTFQPAWGDLAQSYFLLGNWNLLWYGAIAAALLAWRSLLAPALVPLTTVVAGGLVFLFFVFAFTTASAFITDQTTVNRATLHVAPLVVVFMVLAWAAFAQRWALAHPAAPPRRRPPRQPLVDLRRSARRGREAEVAAGQRRFAPAEAREEFRLPALRARVDRLRIEHGPQAPFALGHLFPVARIGREVLEFLGIGVEVEELRAVRDVVAVLPAAEPQHEGTGDRADRVILGHDRPRRLRAVGHVEQRRAGQTGAERGRDTRRRRGSSARSRRATPAWRRRGRRRCPGPP